MLPANLVKFTLMRRSVKSQPKNRDFPTRRIPVAFGRKISVSSITIPCDTEPMVCAMKKAGVLSILFGVVLLAVVVVAEAQQPKKSSPDRIPKCSFAQ
jgi:hypothetical protein